MNNHKLLKNQEPGHLYITLQQDGVTIPLCIDKNDIKSWENDWGTILKFALKSLKEFKKNI